MWWSVLWKFISIAFLLHYFLYCISCRHWEATSTTAAATADSWRKGVAPPTTQKNQTPVSTLPLSDSSVSQLLPGVPGSVVQPSLQDPHCLGYLPPSLQLETGQQQTCQRQPFHICRPTHVEPDTSCMFVFHFLPGNWVWEHLFISAGIPQIFSDIILYIRIIIMHIPVLRCNV